MTTLSPSFTAGGLASNIDTNSIIDGLVKLQRRPLDLLQQQQSGLKAQVSTLGDIASKLAALESAAQALGDGGVLGVKATSAATAFAAVPGSGAVAGSYQVRVLDLAAAAKARSQGFSAADVVKGGSLDIAVDGQHYAVPPPLDGIPQTWADGASLEDVAAAIRASGAPVSAVVLDDGSNRYLSITKRDTGYPAGVLPGEALVFTLSWTGTAGRELAFAATQPPKNASFELDGLPFTRTSNVVADAIPGVTLTLKTKGGIAEDLALENDVDATRANLKKYVDTYNAVVAIVQKQLSPAQNTDRSATLAGSSMLRGLQQRLQALGSQSVPGLSTVRTLADVGVKTNRDGALSIDDDALSGAIGREPGAVNALFATASSGVADAVKGLVEGYVRAGDGVLTQTEQGLQDSIARLDDGAEQLQARLDSYRRSLSAQFAAMEQIVSRMKSVGTFLTNQAAQQQSGK